MQAKGIIGWREWVGLPDLGVASIKVKVDTGARTSSLHASELETFREDGREMVRFEIHPRQRSTAGTVLATAEVVDWRHVRSSGGHRTLRPVIHTSVDACGITWEIELTLIGRDEMGFRMLLGRQAVRGRFTVDPGRSYVGGRPARNGAARRKKAAGNKAAGKKIAAKQADGPPSVRKRAVPARSFVRRKGTNDEEE